MVIPKKEGHRVLVKAVIKKQNHSTKIIIIIVIYIYKYISTILSLLLVKKHILVHLHDNENETSM